MHPVNYNGYKSVQGKICGGSHPEFKVTREE